MDWRGKRFAKRAGSTAGLGRPPGGGNLLQYSCLENSHGQKSLVGHSPLGHKEPAMTDHTSTHMM